MIIDWANRVVNIELVDMTQVQSTPFVVYELDLNWLRLALHAQQEGEQGIAFPQIHTHNTSVALGGVTLARVIQIINGYTVTFENGAYAVSLVGANSNVADVANLNQVSLRSFNSAGLVQITSGGAGATASDIWSYADRTLSTPGIIEIQTGLATGAEISSSNSDLKKHITAMANI